MRRSAANASAIGLEPSDCPAISRGTGLRDEPRMGQLREPLRELREQRAARGGADDGVGQLPAELLRDLERDRLRALARVRMEVAADEAPREERAELELESAAVVVRAVDREDARAGMPRGDRPGADACRREHDRLEAGRRGGRGDGVAEVAGRRAADGREAVLTRGGDGDARDAILVRARRVRAFELQQKLDTEQLGKAVAAFERRPPGRRRPRVTGSAAALRSARARVARRRSSLR